MLKIIIHTICLLVILSSCTDSDKYLIEGKIKNFTDEEFYVVFESDDIKDIDTIQCNKPGEFLFSKYGEFDQVSVYLSNKEQWFTFYPEKGKKTSISGDFKNPLSIEIKGGEVNNQLNKLKKEFKPLLKEQAEIIQLLDKNTSAINSENAELSARLTNVNHQLKETAEKMIRKHPNQKASVILIEKFFMLADNTRKMDELLAVLEPKAREFFLVSKLENFSNRAKRTEIGSEAPDFLLQNIYGKPLNLDTFANKYLLLTFTSSWFEMDKNTRHYLEEIKKTYEDKDIELLLVSLDTDPIAIRDTLANDSIKWNLVTDSAGQSSSLIDLYNINALPNNFLIDKEKEILFKTDNGIELKKTLEAITEE